MRPMATRNGEMSGGTLLAAALFVATLGLMASAWDERDFAELRAEAQAAKEALARLAVEYSGYSHFYNAAEHCRVPSKDERLEMVLAHPDEPGNGYRCLYWRRHLPGYGMRQTVTWSRSPRVVLSESGEARQ